MNKKHTKDCNCKTWIITKLLQQGLTFQKGFKNLIAIEAKSWMFCDAQTVKGIPPMALNINSKKKNTPKMLKSKNMFQIPMLQLQLFAWKTMKKLKIYKFVEVKVWKLIKNHHQIDWCWKHSVRSRHRLRAKVS